MTKMKKLSHEYQLFHPYSIYTQKIEKRELDAEVPIILESRDLSIA